MNPGATTRPRASMVRAAVAPDVAASPTKTMRSPRMPTSAVRAGAPVPSTTDPPRMRTSTRCCAASVGAAPSRSGTRPAAPNHVAILRILISSSEPGTLAKKPNYNFEKSRREQDRKKKKEEKRQRKLEASRERREEPPAGDAG